MMRAEFRELGDGVVLKVCGRLTEGWVSELEQCWRANRTTHPNTRISVDLRGVTFIDQAGEGLLHLMHRDGASFLADGLMIREVVSQITGGSK
jgi:anti-anti-sigma regulatory factor